MGEALRSDPRRFLTSLWPLRALAYTASGVVVGAVTLVWLPTAMVLGAVVGVPVLTRPLVALERRRLVLLGGPAVPDPHRSADRPGPVAWLRSRYAEPVTWRELAYLVLHATLLLLLDAIATALAFVPILIFGVGSFVRTGSDQGVPRPIESTDIVVVVVLAVLAAIAVLVVAGVVLYTVPSAALAPGGLARLLLAPGAEGAVWILTHSRARLIDAFEVERRRIERDLHDGAQQHLLELGITLVAAELEHSTTARSRPGPSYGGQPSSPGRPSPSCAS